MTYSDFHNRHFEAKVTKALESVRRVLDVDRGKQIALAEDVDHVYQDKYKLADLMTNMTIVTLVSVLERLGLTKEVLRGIDKSKEITLRFSTTESCTFLKEEIVDEPLPYTKETKETTNVATEFGTEESTTTKSTIEKIVKRVKNEHFAIGKDWELSIYSGTDVENRTIIEERKGATCEYIVSHPADAKQMKTSRSFPFPKKKKSDADLSLTWLLQQIDADELKSHFAIDTSPDNDNTKTPKRNIEMDQAFLFFESLSDWMRDRRAHFPKTISTYCRDPKAKDAFVKFDREVLDAIFVPVMPIMVDQNQEETSTEEKDQSRLESVMEGDEEIEPESTAIVTLPTVDASNDCKAVILSELDTTAFLNEHARTLSEGLGVAQDQKFTCSLISSQEAKVHLLFGHALTLAWQFMTTITTIESMLKQQLIAAIGKEVRKADLDKFMRYHNEKFFNPSPKRFCYTIRRPEHYPDGILGIEETAYDDGKEVVEPITTHVREVVSDDPIHVPLNAATTISLTGKTYLHGWLNYRFGGEPSNNVRLNARARQFSSFVLVVGTMTNQNHLQPKDAIILRNKDEVHIPLLLNEIPTATEFKDAISSLSPEQQRFANSFRSMQLDSSVLGVCVIQIKPQLEKLLGLPEGALTKEMKLTEDLTELFIEYQVPSDLVSCEFGDIAEGIYGGNVKEKVENVRGNVKAVMDVIKAQKEEQLEEQKKAAEMAKAQRKAEAAPSPFGAPSPFSAAPAFGSAPTPVLTRGRALASAGVANISLAGAPGRGAPRGGRGGRGGGRGGLLDAVKARGIGAQGYSARVASSSVARGKALMGEVNVRADGKKLRRIRKNRLNKQAETTSQSEISLPGNLDNENGIVFDNEQNLESNGSECSPSEKVVFAEMPKILDSAIESYDKNAALRSTTIKTAESNWTRLRQENLLSTSKRQRLAKGVIESEKSRAFDLLDALSRSGSLDISYSDLHVLICATHGFDKSIMSTVIEDNINPIEKLEIMSLLMASTTLGVPSRDLIRDEHDRKRLATSFPRYLTNGEETPEPENADDDSLAQTDC